MRWLLLLVLFESACGTLVDDVEPPSSATADAGLSCAADDPCTCAPCATTADCASGLQCVPGRRKGMNCSDGRLVCQTGP